MLDFVASYLGSPKSRLEDSLNFKLRCLFQFFHSRHGACSVVRTLIRLRASVAFGGRMLL